MALKWSISWIGLFIIFSQHIENCVSSCGCGGANKGVYSSGSNIKTTQPKAGEKVSIDLPKLEESEYTTRVIAGVCQANESFWIAIGLKDFFQKHIMKDAGENNQQKFLTGQLRLARAEKVGSYDSTGSRSIRTNHEPKVLLLSDLEGDNLNPQECCVRLNSCVTPRLGAQVLLITLLFLSGHWWLSLSNVPLLFWFMFEKIILPKNNAGVYDLLEIYSRNGIQKHMMKSLLNISWLLIALAFNMYFAMQALLSDDELQELPLKWNNTEY